MLSVWTEDSDTGAGFVREQGYEEVPVDIDGHAVRKVLIFRLLGRQDGAEFNAPILGEVIGEDRAVPQGIISVHPHVESPLVWGDHDSIGHPGILDDPVDLTVKINSVYPGRVRVEYLLGPHVVVFGEVDPTQVIENEVVSATVSFPLELVRDGGSIPRLKVHARDSSASTQGVLGGKKVAIRVNG